MIGSFCHTFEVEQVTGELQMHPTTHILIFARYPVSGEAKTRLIPALGPERAARLHRRMTEHAVGIARKAVAAGEENAIEITVCYTGGRRKEFQAWLGSDLHYERQSSGHLGVRLRQAFVHSFERGATLTLAIGADIPGVSLEILRQAIHGVRDRDVVLGPAADGGYYLIGTKQFYAGLFTGIDWGTGQVLHQTCNAIKRLGLTVETLPTLNDIDRPEDLSVFHDDPRFTELLIGEPLISVIIPTLNEAVILAQTIQSVRNGNRIEIIVTDGGSRDRTCELAVKAGVTLLEVVGGRAAQLNAGAADAKGSILFFLHADTHPPSGYANQIRTALDDPATVAGAFRFRTDGTGTAMRVIEWATNFRSTRLQWPYGDQGLFLEKRIFDELGGFTSLPIMEDFDLVRRLRRRGFVATLRDAAVTSARRWEQLGPIRTTVINQIMIAGFISGFPVHWLKRLYRIVG
jgi:uncharacterized protein